MTHQGSCHCGKIAFEFDGDIAEVMDCNCSMCQRRGGLLWFTSPDHFRLKTPRDEVSTYHFNRHAIDHHFCATCGVAPFSEGKTRKGDAMVMINARCVEGIDLGALTIKKVDGRSF